MLRPLPFPAVLPFLASLMVSACAVHHVTPYVPDAGNAPQTEDAAEASANCAEAGTPSELAICGDPALVAAHRAMLAAWQGAIRGASLFGRDCLIASQRAFWLGLPAGRGLGAALAARTQALRAWPGRFAQGGAIAQYVTIRAAAGAAAQKEPAFCAAFADRANAALRRGAGREAGALGYREVAGTHGAAAAGGVSVDLYAANVYALFQLRARGVGLAGGTPVISPISLTQLVESRGSANQGGRFSAFASQTGDYAGIDVFADGGRTLVLAADPWGSTTPAAPGEAAHVGIWALGAVPAPVCLFDSYARPAEPGVFADLPDFSAWRAVLDRIRASADLPLGTAFRRDAGQLAADSDFVVLHMPLLAVEQARTDGWTPWLRARHDAVLDALFAWSAKDAANKALFDRAFTLLRPAATELVRAYQTSQGLSGAEATQAGGIAVMEMLYEATATIAPELGGDPVAAVGYRPRYPILASPQ